MRLSVVLHLKPLLSRSSVFNQFIGDSVFWYSFFFAIGDYEVIVSFFNYLGKFSFLSSILVLMKRLALLAVGKG